MPTHNSTALLFHKIQSTLGFLNVTEAENKSLHLQVVKLLSKAEISGTVISINQLETLMMEKCSIMKLDLDKLLNQYS